MGRLGRALVYVGCALVAGILYFALARPVQVLPLMATVPPFELVDPRGAPFRSHERAGQVGIYTFGVTRDGAGVEAAARTFREFSAALAREPELADRLELVFIALDGDTATSEGLHGIYGRFGDLHGLPFHVLTGSWVALRLAVGTGFGVYYEPPPEEDPEGAFIYEPTVIIVDGNGVMRARYPLEQADAATLVRDMRLLTKEAAAAGAERWVYAGAHLFLCYPR